MIYASLVTICTFFLLFFGSESRSTIYLRENIEPKSNFVEVTAKSKSDKLIYQKDDYKCYSRLVKPFYTVQLSCNKGDKLVVSELINENEVRDIRVSDNIDLEVMNKEASTIKRIYDSRITEIAVGIFLLCTSVIPFFLVCLTKIRSKFSS